MYVCLEKVIDTLMKKCEMIEINLPIFMVSTVVSGYGSRSVLNLEHGSVGLVGGGFGVIVHVLSGEERFLVRDQVVGGSGFIDKLVGLGGGSYYVRAS